MRHGERDKDLLTDKWSERGIDTLRKKSLECNICDAMYSKDTNFDIHIDILNSFNCKIHTMIEVLIKKR